MAKMPVYVVMSHLATAAGINLSEVNSGKTTTHYGANHWAYEMGGKTYGGPVDCSGLIYAIGRKVDSTLEYHTSSWYGINAAGDISTVPEEHGIYLWKDGHVAIYTGNGYTIEAIDTATGCGRRGNRLGAFTKWGRLGWVQY